MKLDKIFTVKKSVSKDDFLRAALIDLATSEDTPSNIMSATFKEVEELKREVIGFIANLNAEYDCSVGYERREEYWDKEKKTKNGQTYYVDVKKTRTVVDWKPHHGKTSGKISCFAYNDVESSYIGDDDYILEVFKKTSNKDIKSGGEMELTENGLESAKHTAEGYLELQTRFPGNKHKDVSMQTEFDIKKIEGYIFPSYRLKYVYGGETYEITGLATGYANTRYEELPKSQKDNWKKANADTFHYKVLAIVFGVLQAIAFVLGCASIIPVIPQWVWFVAWVPLLAVMVVSIALRVKKSKKIKSQLDNEDANKKITDLNKILKEKGFKPYTKK